MRSLSVDVTTITLKRAERKVFKAWSWLPFFLPLSLEFATGHSCCDSEHAYLIRFRAVAQGATLFGAREGDEDIVAAEAALIFPRFLILGLVNLADHLRAVGDLGPLLGRWTSEHKNAG